MRAKLYCKTGKLAGCEFYFGTEASIGSRPENTIMLAPRIISGRHARIFFDPRRRCYMLEDLNSRNGTKIDGVPVKSTEKLGHLHVITFAKIFDFIFQVLPDDSGIGNTETQPGTATDLQPVSQAWTGKSRDTA